MRIQKLRAIALAGLALFLFNLNAPASAEAESKLVGVVNINTATEAQLELLPGVGPARAQAILAHRKKIGEFASVDQLRDISGIGESALGRMRGHCVTKGKTTAELKQ